MSRSATSAIRGYSYQFHKSIVEILSLKKSQVAQLEAIEDIDKLSSEENELVQVKYLSSQKMVQSAVAEPIVIMIDDYIANRAKRKDTSYRLYAHFGDSTGNDSFLKSDGFYESCKRKLSALNQKVNLTRQAFAEFQDRFQLQVGISFEEMEAEVKRQIGQELSVSLPLVENYYYPNAINAILRICCQKDTARRRVSKSEFLKEIDNKSILFGLWKKAAFGKRSYLRDSRQEVLKSFTNVKDRWIYIDTQSFLTDQNGYGIEQLLQDMVEKFTPLKKLDNSKVVTFIVKPDALSLLDLKKVLIERNILFNDGYEHIEFSIQLYDTPPVYNTDRTKRICNSSYAVRILGLDTFISHQDQLRGPNVAVYFAKDVPFRCEHAIEYRITELETYKDIAEILI